MITVFDRKFILIFIILSLFTSFARADVVVKFGHYNKYPPITYGNGKNVSGIIVESIKIIFERVDGYSPEFYGFPWARAQSMVKNDELDAFCTVPTHERKEYAKFGKQIVWSPTQVAFYEKNNPNALNVERIKQKSDLSTVSIVDYIGNGWGEANLSSYVSYKVNNLESAFKMVKYQQVDMHISPYALGKYQLNKLGFDLAHIELPFFDGGFIFQIGIRKNFKNVEELQKKLDQAIAQLHSEGRFKEIRKKYL